MLGCNALKRVIRNCLVWLLESKSAALLFTPAMCMAVRYVQYSCEKTTSSGGGALPRCPFGTFVDCNYQALAVALKILLLS